MADNALYSHGGDGHTRGLVNPITAGIEAGIGGIKPTTPTTPGGGIPTNIPQTPLPNTTPNTPANPTKTGGGGTTKITTPTNPVGNLDALAAERRRKAEEAYNNGMAKLQEIFGRQGENFRNIYNSGAGQIDNSYNNSLGKINQNAEKAMQEAYVNKMLSEKNLSQKLAAQGLSGGASESAMAGLLNNYGNARNNIQTTWNGDLSDLEMQRQNNLADLYNAYQTNLANLEANRGNAELSLLNNLNNQVASIDDSLFEAMLKNPTAFTNTVTKTTNNMNSYTPSEQSANNPNQTVNTQQTTDAGEGTQAARLRALEEMQDALRRRISSNPNINAQQATNWLTGLYGPGNGNSYAEILNRLQDLGYTFR